MRRFDIALIAIFSLTMIPVQAMAQGKDLKLPYNAFLDGPDTDAADLDAADADYDCILDRAEHEVAEYFKPYFIFDSRERARRTFEPVTLYQVTPYHKKLFRSLGERSCSERARILEIIYTSLWRQDGGFGSSSVCDSSHPGDNQAIRIYVWAAAGGKRFKIVGAHLGKALWPKDTIRFVADRHPVLYYSSGKHHHYVRTYADRTKPHAPLGCYEEVDGRGAPLFATLTSDAAPRRFNNVGERAHHPARYFINDLTHFGFPDEDAWGRARFCGGLRGTGIECHGTSSMDSIWR